MKKDEKASKLCMISFLIGYVFAWLMVIYFYFFADILELYDRLYYANRVIVVFRWFYALIVFLLLCRIVQHNMTNKPSEKIWLCLLKVVILVVILEAMNVRVLDNRCVNMFAA